MVLISFNALSVHLETVQWPLTAASSQWLSGHSWDEVIRGSQPWPCHCLWTALPLVGREAQIIVSSTVL